jgi:hypothetical protein
MEVGTIIAFDIAKSEVTSGSALRGLDLWISAHELATSVHAEKELERMLVIKGRMKIASRR